MKVSLIYFDGFKSAWRKKNTAILKENLNSTVKGYGGHVVVWGCMGWNGVDN